MIPRNVDLAGDPLLVADVPFAQNGADLSWQGRKFLDLRAKLRDLGRRCAVILLEAFGRRWAFLQDLKRAEIYVSDTGGLFLVMRIVRVILFNPGAFGVLVEFFKLPAELDLHLPAFYLVEGLRSSIVGSQPMSQNAPCGFDAQARVCC